LLCLNQLCQEAKTVENLTEAQKQVVTMVRDFVQQEVAPVVSELERDDVYPAEIVGKMKELGIFGAIIPEGYGGMGLDYATYALRVEELSKGWMSLGGVINSHLLLAYILFTYGTPEQKERFLPGMASGEKHAGLALTEPNAGSDVQAIETTAVKDGDNYVINGNKLFITNAVHGNTFLVLAKTDPEAEPRYEGISGFIVEKGAPGLTVGRKLDKLGYRGLDTAELIFRGVRCPGSNLVAGVEGQGFRQVMSGLEVGRINVAARAVGVAAAAFEAAIRYAQQRKAFGVPIAQHQAIQLKLADMATQIQAARLLTHDAARKKDGGGRCDLEAGMAKLFASEMCGWVTLEAMRIHGGYGYIKDFPVERYYRDAPLMMIGEGTNEMQKLVIARNLLKQYAL
jgi:alkylation response protein AidB-like acyl-CoA dehydrogenase